MRAFVISALVLATNFAFGAPVRVRLMKNIKEVTVIAEAGVLHFDGEEVEFKTAILNFANGRWRLSIDQDYQTKNNQTFSVQADLISLNGKVTSKTLKFNQRTTSTIDIVNILPLEEYLRGVVPSEMYSRWPLEALKAQAIAARSYAYHRMQERKDSPYDVDASTWDQRFKVDIEIDKNVDRAISQTRNMVLVDKSHRVVEALYHADCGGRTENATAVWGGRSQTSTRTCDHPTKVWSVNIPRRSLLKKFISYFDLDRTTSLQSLQAVGKTQSGRIKEIRADFSRGGVKLLSAQEFRKIVGFDQIPSASFGMRWLGRNLEIRGRGRGHGVGLCQLGARAMALSGQKVHEILQFYYPESRVGFLKAESSKSFAAE